MLHGHNILASVLSYEASSSKHSRGFPYSIQTGVNARILTDSRQIGPRPLQTVSFPVHSTITLSFDLILSWSKLLNEQVTSKGKASDFNVRLEGGGGILESEPEYGNSKYFSWYCQSLEVNSKQYFNQAAAVSVHAFSVTFSNHSKICTEYSHKH